MNSNPNNGANELVLDNRKLIIAFFLLIATCGAFFLIGFMEGKRQSQRAQADQTAAAQPASGALQPQGSTAPPGAKPMDSAQIRSQLEWYDKVSERSPSAKKPGQGLNQAKEVSSSSVASVTPGERSGVPAAPKAEARTEKRSAVGVRYNVQVGAFRQASQAESKAAALKLKGYSCVVTPPSAEGGLYLVTVGDFNSRADAVAMQLRLKKDGFSTFIKSNR